MVGTTRSAFGSIIALSIISSCSPALFAQSYPSKPVKLMVGYAAGGPTDILARIVAQCLSEKMKQAFVVENRAGASGNIATELVVRSAPDGHTLLFLNTGNAVNASVFNSLTFDITQDLVPISGVFRSPAFLVVRPTLGINSLAEFIAFARRSQGALNMASPGVGTNPHVSGELFKMMAAINAAHVPYRGNALAFSDLISGHVDFMFASPVGLVEYVTTKKLKAIGVTTDKRSNLLPDVQPITELVPGYESSSWYGFGAARGTALEIVTRLNSETNACLSEPSMTKRFHELGGAAFLLSAANFGQFIAGEVTKWEKVVAFARIKPE